MTEDEVVYAVQIHKLTSPGLKVLDVKIGKTTNIKATLAQYRRSSKGVKLLNLWKPNKELTLSNCERGVQVMADEYAHDSEGEKFTFLQNRYNDLSEIVSKLLKPTTRARKSMKKKETKIEEKKKKSEIKDYTGKKPKSIRLRDNDFEVKTWRDVVKTVAKEIYNKVEDFSKVTEIKGTKRSYFARNEDELISPKSIPDSPYYFEGRMSAERLVVVAKRILDKFGYDGESDLEISIKRGQER